MCTQIPVLDRRAGFLEARVIGVCEPQIEFWFSSKAVV